MKAEDLWRYRAELVHGIICLDGTRAQPLRNCRLEIALDQLPAEGG